MKQYFYDLHLHSCLSPCGDDDMTPANIAGMASLNGLQILALTDHNSARNTPAFMDACEKMGIVPIPGMEITTAEDIHLVGLFRTVDDAMAFDHAIQPHRILYKNPVEIYGHQYVLDQEDKVVDEDEFLLSNALMLSIEDVVALIREYNGLVYPAHIDRESNGIIAILGAVPEELNFTVVEFHDPESIPSYIEMYGLSDKHIIVSSDAHYLWDIQDAIHAFEFEGDETPDQIRNDIIARLEKPL